MPGSRKHSRLRRGLHIWAGIPAIILIAIFAIALVWEFFLRSSIREHVAASRSDALLIEVMAIVFFCALAIAWPITLLHRNSFYQPRRKGGGPLSGDAVRAILDNVADGIITINAYGLIDNVNRTTETMFGYAAADLVGRNVSILMPEPYRSDHDRYLANYRQTKVGKIIDVGPREVVAQRADGSTFPMELAVSKMVVDGATYFIGVVRNITIRKEAETKHLQQVQKMQAVGQLTGGLAHDFNNLLAAIQGSLEFLGDNIEGNASARKYLEIALRATNRGAALTQRLLAFSRRQTLRPVSTNVNRLIPDITELIRRTLGDDIEIECVLSGGLWNAMVDQNQLENALINLAINARDAMPTGGKLTIETSNARLDHSYAEANSEVAPGQYVLIAMTDTGTGMTQEVQEHAFEPFYSTKEVGKGTGLGLSMVYGLMKQSGGHIKLYSELGEGTTVKLYLPRANNAANENHEPLVASGARLTGTETILVVEDDTDVREFIVAALESFGYRVIESKHGPDALARADDIDHLDLLFTDVVMPSGMSGRDVAAAIQQRFPGVKTLYTSGYTENAIVHHGRLDEGTELLSKPFTRLALAQTVRRLLDEPRG